MSDVIASFGEIHDAQIRSYQVSFAEKKLEMNVGWNGSEESMDVISSGLLAHHFENVIESNILFDIEEVSLSFFLKKHGEFLTRKLLYGFPMNRNDCRSLEQLEAYLREYRFFQIDSSLGLTGFVIAKEISIEKNKT